MLVKLENAQIEVDDGFLHRHFEYVQRLVKSSLAHSDEELDLKLFQFDAFTHLAYFLNQELLEPLDQQALIEMTRLASFLHTINYTDKFVCYLTKRFGYKPLKRNNLNNMTFLFNLTRLLSIDYPELSGEMYGFSILWELDCKTGDSSPNLVDLLIPVGDQCIRFYRSRKEGDSLTLFDDELKQMELVGGVKSTIPLDFADENINYMVQLNQAKFVLCETGVYISGLKRKRTFFQKGFRRRGPWVSLFIYIKTV